MYTAWFVHARSAYCVLRAALRPFIAMLSVFFEDEDVVAVVAARKQWVVRMIWCILSKDAQMQPFDVHEACLLLHSMIQCARAAVAF